MLPAIVGIEIAATSTLTGRLEIGQNQPEINQLELS
jgi:hypothetical protein